SSTLYSPSWRDIGSTTARERPAKPMMPQSPGSAARARAVCTAAWARWKAPRPRWMLPARAGSSGADAPIRAPAGTLARDRDSTIPPATSWGDPDPRHAPHPGGYAKVPHGGTLVG